MDEEKNKPKKSKKENIANFVAMILCLAASPYPCIFLIFLAKSLQVSWQCFILWPVLLCLLIGAVAFLICFSLLSGIIKFIIK